MACSVLTVVPSSSASSCGRTATESPLTIPDIVLVHQEHTCSQKLKKVHHTTWFRVSTLQYTQHLGGEVGEVGVGREREGDEGAKGV
jgi:hypothetical protein